MAIRIIREVTADVIKRGSTRAVYAKQNDINSRFLNVRIQNEGSDILVNPSSTVMLNVERPDKQENIFRGEVNEDGTVRVPMTTWMLELEGTLLCDISIISEDPSVAKLTTMQFNIYVEAAVVQDNSFVETEEYSIIVDLLKRTEDAEAKASEAAFNAETLKQNCEDATIRANEAADELEQIKSELAEGGYIHSIKEKNQGLILSFWVGTQEEYDALEIKPQNCYVIITNDKTLVDIRKSIAAIAVESKDFPGCWYRYVDGEEEWLNPPMRYGIEFRTTERYWGYPVYARIMDVIIPTQDQSTSVALHNYGIRDVVDISGNIYSDDLGLYASLSDIMVGVNKSSHSSVGELVVTTPSAYYENWTARVVLKYLK